MLMPFMAGLFIHKYTLDLLSKRKVTPRGALLLAYVDRKLNPNYPPDVRVTKEPPTSIVYSTSQFRGWLRSSRRTVDRTIEDLTSLRPVVIRARRGGHAGFGEREFKTRRRQTRKGGLLVPEAVLTIFSKRRLSVQDMLVIANVISFGRNDRPCFISNKGWGKFLGVRESRAAHVVQELINDRLLVAEYVTSRSKTQRWLTSSI